MHSRRLAAKESELSGLRLRLGALERENLALTEIVDNHPVIIDAVADHKRNDVWVFAVLLGVALSLLGLFIWKYRSVSDRLNLLTMKQVGELRRIGGEV